MGDDEELRDHQADEEKAAPESDDGRDADEFPNVDELLGTFLSETSLWPVLVVVIGSGGAFGAAILILVGIDRNPFAAGALLLIFGMSVDVFVQSRRKPSYRNIAKLIGLVWMSAFGLAALGIWSGIAL